MSSLNEITIEGRCRQDILNASFSAGKSGAHIAPSLSNVEICLSILKNLREKIDSFILSKGHGALGYYAAMHQLGMITDEQFSSFEKNGGEFPGQPSRSPNNRVECSSGSLGMGLSYALGVSIAKRNSNGRVYVVVGDGELNEGSNWEAAALASKYGLSNLVVIVDYNGLQSDGNCIDIVGQNLLRLWDAYGWYVVECDGHSVQSIEKMLFVNHGEKPLAILAKTTKGKGISFMENNNAWHHATLNEEEYKKATLEIGERYGVHKE